MARAEFPWKILAAASAFGFGVFGIVTLVSRSTKAAVRPLNRPKRFALIGDSYAVGLGPELAKLFPDFRYEGHSGIHTNEWVGRSSKCWREPRHYYDYGQGCGDWLESYQPDVVLVSLGVNDGAHPDQANYQEIVRSLQKTGARILWIEPPARVRTHDTTRMRLIIASLGVPHVSATYTPLDAQYGLHPVDYGPWAQEIAQAIREGVDHDA